VTTTQSPCSDGTNCAAVCTADLQTLLSWTWHVFQQRTKTSPAPHSHNDCCPAVIFSIFLSIWFCRSILADVLLSVIVHTSSITNSSFFLQKTLAIYMSVFSVWVSTYYTLIDLNVCYDMRFVHYSSQQMFICQCNIMLQVCNHRSLFVFSDSYLLAYI